MECFTHVIVIEDPNHAEALYIQHVLHQSSRALAFDFRLFEIHTLFNFARPHLYV